MSLVEHPALTHVYEYGHLDDGGAYIVMEYVEGESLRELLRKRGGKLHVLAALALIRQVASALHIAHEKGVVHRDLKPENIMLLTSEDSSTESRIKILDFGVAKTFDRWADAKPVVTRPGQVIGTPMYMAPEQADMPGKIGGHTDVYALGAVLFELLAGRPPFAGDDAIEIVGKHMFSAPPRLREFVLDADPELEALIVRMLAKEPSSRPTMKELKSQLAKIGKTLGERMGEHRGRPALQVEDPSQADTVITRKSQSQQPMMQTMRISRTALRLRQKPQLLVIGILLIGFVGLGVWLVLSSASPPRQPTPKAPSKPADKPLTPPPSVTKSVDAKPTEPPSVLEEKKPANPRKSAPDDSSEAPRKRPNVKRDKPAARPAKAPSSEKSPSSSRPKEGTPRLVD